MAKGDGLIVMKPTSIVVAGAGSSASINADGGVDFTSATSLSLNGVFTSGFDNYHITIGPLATSGGIDVYMKLRLSGTDTTGSNYATQQLTANNGYAPEGERLTSQSSARIISASGTQRSGYVLHLYGPGLAQATAGRTISARDYASATIDEFALTHSLATAYDGFTLSMALNNFTGSIVVMGYEE